MILGFIWGAILGAVGTVVVLACSRPEPFVHTNDDIPGSPPRRRHRGIPTGYDAASNGCVNENNPPKSQPLHNEKLW